MQFTITTILSALAATAAALPTEKALAKRDSIPVTGHVEFESSIGVLGCKINTNRIAYFPSDPNCNDICVKMSHQGRSTHLLHVGKSGGKAYDISYDAWNYLISGKNATVDPQQGGQYPMEYEYVDMRDCSHLIHESTNGKLPFSSTGGLNYLSACQQKSDSFATKNHALYNIYTTTCTAGIDEQCSIDWTTNIVSCPHQNGLMPPMTNETVTNIAYGTGKLVAAAQ